MPKRDVALPSLIMCSGAVAFLAASLSTQHWIEAAPYNLDGLENITDDSFYKGEIHCGLFQGYQKLKTHLVTPMINILNIVCSDGVCMYSSKKEVDERIDDLQNNLVIGTNDTVLRKNDYLIPQGFWISTVVFVCLSILMGVVGGVFSVINAVMNPVELITSLRGVHVWNIFGGTCGAVSMTLWGVLYSESIEHNILSKTELEGRWISEGTASFGFSFWFVLIGLIFYAANSTFILLKTMRPWEKKLPKMSEGGERPTGNIMLY